jgi:hypothetical protein
LDLAAKLRLVLEADATELERMSQNSLHLIQAHDIQRTLDIFEDLYQGFTNSDQTTQDNDPSYLLPIGRLSQGLVDRIAEIKVEAVELRRKAEEFSFEAKEKLEQASQEVRVQLGEIKEGVKEQAKKLRKRLEP